MLRPGQKKYHKVNLEISNICNLQCSFCPEVIRSKKLIDITVFENIIKQIAPLTELVCFHLMGDPLVHPHLPELIKICEKHEAKVFFVTNGVLLKDVHHEILTNKTFHQINFSLHSFFDNYPEKDPTIYLDKILRFTDHALSNKPELYINFRLWNLQDIRGGLTENQKMLERIEKHYGFKLETTPDVRRQKSLKITGRLYLHFDTEFVWPDVNLPVLGEKGTCYGLTSHFGILVDGTVVPCCLDKEGKIPLGNVHENSIADILNSSRSQAMLQGFRNHKLVENLCHRCQYIERFQ